MKVQTLRNRTLFISGPGQIGFLDQEIKGPASNQILVKVSACGICGSDLRPYRAGELDIQYFGHEFTGIVLAVGREIMDFNPGDRVASGLASGCGICEACRKGLPNFCENARNQFIPGGFAEYCLITCANGCKPLHKLPDSLDDIRATCFEPLSCAMRIAERAKVVPASRILILGLGMMGVLSGILLKKYSPESLIVCADNHKGRVSAAEKLGLGHCVQLESGNITPILAIASTFDLVIDATGSAAVFPLAIDLACLGGRVVLAGVPSESIAFAPLPIFRKELTVVGAKGPYPYPKVDEGSYTLDLLSDPGIPWDILISVLSFDDAKEGFENAAGGGLLKVILAWQKTK